MLHLWFVSGFLLAVCAAVAQLIAVYVLVKKYERSHWITTLYIVLDSVILVVGLGWVAFGAYWRFSDQG